MNDLATLKKIEQSRLAIREVKTLDEIKTLIDQSEALKAYAKSAQLSAEIQADIAELNLRATRRLGEISMSLEKSKGKRTDLVRATDEVECPNSGQSKTETLAGIGVSRQRANEAEKIASIPEEVFDNLLKTSKTDTAGASVSKSDIVEFARMDPEQQKAVAEKIAAGTAESIADAQRKLKKEEADKKQTEAQKSYERVAAYRKTGKKPEGWRRGTDDKLAQEEAERDAKIAALKAESLNRRVSSDTLSLAV